MNATADRLRSPAAARRPRRADHTARGQVHFGAGAGAARGEPDPAPRRPPGAGRRQRLRQDHAAAPAAWPAAAQQRQLHPAPLRPAPVTAMLFQRPFLLHLSVRRNLHLALWLAGVPGSRTCAQRGWPRRCSAWACRTTAERPARTLSGGQQQRLALARAWALQPDILFLDEPTASLDPGQARGRGADRGPSAATGMTMVMSTHNLGQVKRLASRVAYLDAGRLLVDLPTSTDFFHRPSRPRRRNSSKENCHGTEPPSAQRWMPRRAAPSPSRAWRRWHAAGRSCGVHAQEKAS
jgi:ABC-type polar amino acid transport system ATPase subunit